MSDVVRMISASKSDFEKMSPMDLKESVLKSEGLSWASICCLQEKDWSGE